MTQLNIDQLTVGGGTSTTLDPAKVASVFGQWRVGSILNSPFSGVSCNGDPSMVGLNTTQWRTLVAAVQQAAMASSTIQPPIPVLYGLDSVHGANYIPHSTLFPHNTGMAASFRPDLAQQAASVAARDTRAAGIPWLFAPVLGAGIQPLWSRLYETFGEDPFLISVFGAAVVNGMENRAVNGNVSAASCLKHYLGYPATRSGKDRTDAWIPDAYLRQYFAPPFAAAMAAGASSVMINSASINGVPVHASAPILTDLLRSELNFSGVAVTDWQDIEKLYFYHQLAANNTQAVTMAVEAGVDMSMVPLDLTFGPALLSLVQAGVIPESRLDESVRRILQMKIDLGLFDSPVVPAHLEAHQSGSPADEAIAQQLVRESVTLLQNNAVTSITQPTSFSSSSSSSTSSPMASHSSRAAAPPANQPTLPLTWLPKGSTILVVGPAAVDRVALCGGWTYHWQGACGDYEFVAGASIADGLTALAQPRGLSVKTFQGANFSDVDPANLVIAQQLASQAAVVVLAIGEAPESETPGNTESLDLDPAQVALFNAVAASGTPIVTILVEPRPRVLGNVATQSAAILMAYLPCYNGGPVLAEILFGVTNPSGKLPLTYPRTTGDIDVYYRKPAGPPAGVVGHNPLFDFGFGLSYSTLVYSNLQLSQTSVGVDDILTVSVTVSNQGPYNASEAVLVFVSQNVRTRITPEVKLLKGFDKQPVPLLGSTTFAIPFRVKDLAYWTPTLEEIVEAGVYTVTVENLSATFTVTETQVLRRAGAPRPRDELLRVEP